MHTTDPHYREAAGAIAAMTETYGYTPSVGDHVQCELPFRGTYAIGVVTAVNAAVVVVEVDGETLWYYPHDLTYAGR